MSSTDKETQRLNEKKDEFVLYKYRFVILLAYVISTTQVSLMWGIFNPLQSTLKNVYGESITLVNFGTILISNFAFIPASFIANYIIEHLGLRIGVYLGSFLGLVGLWIRCLSSHGFAWIFVGQFFGGIAQPFFLSTPQKFSNVWFGEHERAYSTTFMICTLTLGVAVGSIIPQGFVDIYADNETILSQFQVMMLFFAILGSVCFVITLILMREKPLTPPSKAAAADKLDVSTSLRTFFRDRNTVIMVVTTAIIYGTAGTYLSVAQQASEPLGFNGNEIGDILSLAIVFCLAGAAIGAVIIEKYKKYNMLIIGSSLYSLIVLVINIFGIQSRNVYFYALSVILFAFLIGPLQPISLEYGVELAFPVSEETIGGLWFTVNQLSSAIEALVIDTVLGQSPTPSDTRTVFYIMIGVQVIAIIPLFFVKQNLKRLNYENGIDFAGKQDIGARGTFDTIQEEYHSPKEYIPKEFVEDYPAL